MTTKATPRRIVLTLDCYDNVDTVEATDLSPEIIHGSLRDLLRRVAPPTDSLTDFRLKRLAALRAEIKAEMRSHFVFCEGCRRRIREHEPRATDEHGVVTCVGCWPFEDAEDDMGEDPTLPMLPSPEVMAMSEAAWEANELARYEAEHESVDPPVVTTPWERPAGQTMTIRNPPGFQGEFGDAEHLGLCANDTNDTNDDPANDTRF